MGVELDSNSELVLFEFDDSIIKYYIIKILYIIPVLKN